MRYMPLPSNALHAAAKLLFLPLLYFPWTNIGQPWSFITFLRQILINLDFSSLFLDKFQQVLTLHHFPWTNFNKSWFFITFLGQIWLYDSMPAWLYCCMAAWLFRCMPAWLWLTMREGSKEGTDHRRRFFFIWTWRTASNGTMEQWSNCTTS